MEIEVDIIKPYKKDEFHKFIASSSPTCISLYHFSIPLHPYLLLQRLELQQ